MWEGRGTEENTIIINNRCPSRQIELKTNLQAIAVNVTLHRTINICSKMLLGKGEVQEEIQL